MESVVVYSLPVGGQVFSLQFLVFSYMVMWLYSYLVRDSCNKNHTETSTSKGSNIRSIIRHRWGRLPSCFVICFDISLSARRLLKVYSLQSSFKVFSYWVIWFRGYVIFSLCSNCTAVDPVAVSCNMNVLNFDPKGVEHL